MADVINIKRYVSRVQNQIQTAINTGKLDAKRERLEAFLGNLHSRIAQSPLTKLERSEITKTLKLLDS